MPRHTFPQALGVRGIADLNEHDYIIRADELRLSASERADYYTAAARRHRAMIERSERDSLRHYGTREPSGRLRRFVSYMRADNERTAAELEQLARRWRWIADEEA